MTDKVNHVNRDQVESKDDQFECEMMTCDDNDPRSKTMFKSKCSCSYIMCDSCAIQCYTDNNCCPQCRKCMLCDGNDGKYCAENCKNTLTKSLCVDHGNLELIDSKGAFHMFKVKPGQQKSCICYKCQKYEDYPETLDEYIAMMEQHRENRNREQCTCVPCQIRRTRSSMYSCICDKFGSCEYGTECELYRNNQLPYSVMKLHEHPMSYTTGPAVFKQYATYRYLLNGIIKNNYSIQTMLDTTIFDKDTPVKLVVLSENLYITQL